MPRCWTSYTASSSAGSESTSARSSSGRSRTSCRTCPTWSPAYPDQFARHTGYRIEDVIAALWDDLPSLPGGAEPARVRADYQRVRAALAEDAFFKPLHAWHERHGLTVGVDQQSPSRAGEPLGCTRQYADYARTHRWFSAPGSDHHGEAKIHSSLAHHYDRPRTWIESFHSSGWGGTLEETFDWLVPWLLAGATLYNPHAVYYSTRGGWWEWAPPSTCWRQPYWPHYKQFADTVSRLCWLLTRGEHVCDVGVLYPSATVQAGTLVKGALPAGERAHRAYLDVVGRMVWYDAKPGVLNRAHRDFDVLDDDTVASADVRAGALHTGGESYRAVVLPACAVLEGPTARTLAEFCRAGGLLVVVGDRPTLATGQDGDDAVRALRGLLDDGSAVAVDDVDELPAVLERLGRTVDSGGPVLHRRVGPLNVLVVPAAPEGTATAQPMLRKGANWFAGPREHGYDFDAARFREEAVVSVPPSAAAVEQWDPLAGTARPAVTRRVGDRLDVTVTFDQVPAAVLVWKDPATGDGETGTRGAGATGAEPRGAARTGATQTGATQTGAAYTGATQKGADHSTGDRPAVDPGVDLDAGWTVSVAPTLDNRYGDLALPASDGAFPLQQWRLRHRVETGAVDGRWAQPDLDDSDWTDVLVGQGLFGWRSRPLAATDVPEPLPAGYDGPLDGSHDRPGHGEGEGHAEGAAPPDAPNAPGWQPVRYSLSRGIEKDPFQARMLGPKGRVPDDFWHVEGVRAGQLVVLRTALPVDVEQDLTLAVGTNGAAEVWWNGVPLGPDPGGYLRLDPVRARADTNLLEVRVTADVNGALRGYWALSTDAAAFVRPAWLVPADGSARGTALVARGRVDLPAAPARAVLQLGTDGPARLVVNGQEIATQGAFEPYGTQNRVLPYDVTAHLVPGENQIEVRFTDIGRPLAVFADALVEYPDGATATFVTDGSWTFARDGAPVPTALRRTHPYDPAVARCARGRTRCRVPLGSNPRPPTAPCSTPFPTRGPDSPGRRSGSGSSYPRARVPRPCPSRRAGSRPSSTGPRCLSNRARWPAGPGRRAAHAGGPGRARRRARGRCLVGRAAHVRLRGRSPGRRSVVRRRPGFVLRRAALPPPGPGRPGGRRCRSRPRHRAGNGRGHRQRHARRRPRLVAVPFRPDRCRTRRDERDRGAGLQHAGAVPRRLLAHVGGLPRPAAVGTARSGSTTRQGADTSDGTAEDP